MKIAVIGTRGFPNVQGGVEAHCLNLYPRLAKLGCDVTVFARAPYVGDKPYEYEGVKIVPVACPKHKFLEAFLHTWRAIGEAAKIKPDIIHIHAIGPGIFAPLARKLGAHVVFTHHGPDYERKKWNRLAKAVLRTGEKRAAASADAIIAVSSVISRSLKEKFGREVIVIPNGVVIPQPAGTQEALRRFGLERGKYVLVVGRIVPEKGISELIEAFSGFQDSSFKTLGKLVIVGDADHEDAYSLRVKELAKKVPGIVLTGRQTGKPLEELYSHAGLFVLPSFYEGLPIVLLEAMSYGLSCIVSDIPANREVGLDEERYFKAGDIEAMAQKIAAFMDKPLSEEARQALRSRVAKEYDWGRIAAETVAVYRSCKTLGSSFK